MKKLKSFSNQAEALMISNLLNDNDINSFVRSDDIGGMTPGVAFTTGGYIVFIDEKDYPEALKLIEAFTNIKK